MARVKGVLLNKRIIAVIDTEAAPVVHGLDKVMGSAMRVYDFGYIIKDKYTPETYVERSIAVTDYYHLSRLMDSAYYAEKLPQYRAGTMAGGEWEPMNFADMRRQFLADCRAHGVTEVWAYNAKFDRDTLNASIADVSSDVCRYFLPYGMAEWRDIWPLAQLITGTKRYNEWCYEHGFYGDTGIAKTNVDTIIKYLTDDLELTERHTALDDAKHEAAILDALRFRHYKTPDKLGNGYRAAMAYAKANGHYIPKSSRAK